MTERKDVLPKKVKFTKRRLKHIGNDIDALLENLSRIKTNESMEAQRKLKSWQKRRNSGEGIDENKREKLRFDGERLIYDISTIFL